MWLPPLPEVAVVGKRGHSSRPGRLIGQKKESEGLWEERNDVEDISPVAVSR